MTGFDSKWQMAADKLQEHKALKLALEALEAVNPSLVCDMAHHSKKYQHGIGQTCPLEIRHLETITAIKAALAQPAQEPVAYVTGMSFGRFIVEPLNRAMVLPVGMALYSLPQKNT